jgi:hypothetical protein
MLRNIRNKRFRKGQHALVLVLCCLLSTVYCLLFIACGKKGEPTLKSYEKPDTPTGLRAIHRESEIIVLWDFPRNKEASIKGFHLLKSSDGDFQKLAFIENAGRSFSVPDFKIGLPCKYKVVSENLRGILSNDSAIIDIKSENPPAPPVNISFRIEYNSLTLTWDSAGEGVYYNIYRSEKKGSYTLNSVNNKPVKDTFFTVSFDIKKPIYYIIRSLTGSLIRDEGPASAEITVDPAELVPSAPEALQAVVAKEHIYLIWKEPQETWVVGYRVYREVNKEEGFRLIAETRSPSFIDNENIPVKRSYRVTAIGPVKEGPPIEIRDVVVTTQ